MLAGFSSTLNIAIPQNVSTTMNVSKIRTAVFKRVITFEIAKMHLTLSHGVWNFRMAVCPLKLLCSCEGQIEQNDTQLSWVGIQTTITITWSIPFTAIMYSVSTLHCTIGYLS